MRTSKYNKSNIDKILRKDKPFQRGSWITSKHLLASFKYAFQGLNYSFASQRNFRIHFFISILVGFTAILLKLPVTQLAILVITVASVLVLELINTSIESIVNLAIGRRFHPLARIAKDCAAASVLVASISSFIIAILLILPPILKKLAL